MQKQLKQVLKMIMPLLLITILAGCGSSGAASNDGSDSEANDKLAQIKETGKLVVGTSPDFPPFEFYMLDENGKKQIAGSDIKLAQAIADEIGVELEIKATDFSGVLANIASGEIDMGISGFSKTEKRKETMQFSDGYQREDAEGYQGLLVSKETAKKYKNLDELKAAKLTIGAQSGSIQYEMALKLTDANKVKQYSTVDAQGLAVNLGDIDAVAVSTSSVEPLLTTFPDLVLLPRDEFDLDPTKMYSTNVIGFPKGDEYQSLIDLSNKVIKKALDNGDMSKWIEEAKQQSAKQVEE